MIIHRRRLDFKQTHATVLAFHVHFIHLQATKTRLPRGLSLSLVGDIFGGNEFHVTHSYQLIQGVTQCVCKCLIGKFHDPLLNQVNTVATMFQQRLIKGLRLFERILCLDLMGYIGDRTFLKNQLAIMVIDITNVFVYPDDAAILAVHLKTHIACAPMLVQVLINLAKTIRFDINSTHAA